MIKQSIHILLLLTAIICFLLVKQEAWRPNNTPPYQFVSDVDQYYSYLPAAIIHKDLGFHYPNTYWLVKNQHGINLPKGSMGMSYLYAPGFLIGHAIALNSTYKADGYSLPYSLGVKYCMWLYLLIGVVYLTLALQHFVNKWLAAATVFFLFFGTNLLYYTASAGEMPHLALFSLFSIVIYYLIHWHNTGKPKYVYIISFLFGLIVIIRPVEIFFLLFIVLYGVYNKSSFLLKINFLLKQYKAILIGILLFLIPIIPQLLYWKIIGGDWLVFSYGSEEKFFFNDPKILDFLIGYRKGWLVYTPLMIFSIIGFFFMTKKMKSILFPSILFITLTIYLLSSWWCWWYGGSFGMRAMIQYYAILAFPFAVFLEYILSKKVLLFTLVPILFFFTYYNLLYSYKYQYWTMHWDSMTKDAYWHTFMKTSFKTDEERNRMEELLQAPNYQDAQKGIR